MTTITTPSGLEYEDVTIGTESPPAQGGHTVTVHYTGWLASDGTEFDTSRKINDPFQFTIGAGEVIAGWDEGVRGMQVGGVRKLTVPPSLAYGPRGAGRVIPPNATLKFEIELMSALYARP